MAEANKKGAESEPPHPKKNIYDSLPTIKEHGHLPSSSHRLLISSIITTSLCWLELYIYYLKDLYPTFTMLKQMTKADI